MPENTTVPIVHDPAPAYESVDRPTEQQRAQEEVAGFSVSANHASEPTSAQPITSSAQSSSSSTPQDLSEAEAETVSHVHPTHPSPSQMPFQPCGPPTGVNPQYMMPYHPNPHLTMQAPFPYPYHPPQDVVLAQSPTAIVPTFVAPTPVLLTPAQAAQYQTALDANLRQQAEYYAPTNFKGHFWAGFLFAIFPLPCVAFCGLGTAQRTAYHRWAYSCGMWVWYMIAGSLCEIVAHAWARGRCVQNAWHDYYYSYGGSSLSYQFDLSICSFQFTALQVVGGIEFFFAVLAAISIIINRRKHLASVREKQRVEEAEKEAAVWNQQTQMQMQMAVQMPVQQQYTYQQQQAYPHPYQMPYPPQPLYPYPPVQAASAQQSYVVQMPQPAVQHPAVAHSK